LLAWTRTTGSRRASKSAPLPHASRHYGNSANDALISPGIHTFDLSLGKNWAVEKLGERGRLQFRAEAFNALNTPQFGAPNGLSWVSQDSIVPDAPRVGEVRSLRQPMRIFQFGLKIYF
jgi:hypothetical protein